MQEVFTEMPRKTTAQAKNTTKITLPPPPPPIQVPKPNLAMTKEDKEAYICKELQQEQNFPQELPVKDTISKLGLMWPRTYSLHHEAIPLLLSYAKQGCLVDCGEDWDMTKIMAMLERGPHISAKDPQAITQLQAETKEKVKNNYARVVRFSDIRSNIPNLLKISPVTMIPHKSKAFCCILDLSFELKVKNGIIPSVNSTTNKLAKPEGMVQLGMAVKRLATTMADHFDLENPFIFSKLDIKDGFWRMAVSNEDAWNFCYVLPTHDKIESINNIELVVPNSLQMGWCESPPFFCASTETARDVIATLIAGDSLPQHKFEHIMLRDHLEANQGTPENDEPGNTTTLVEVFVDDFITATNNQSTKHLTHVSRAMLHGVHSIFPPPAITNHPGEDPISQKKLANGEGALCTTKEILGWEVDGEAFTIKLPTKKSDTICTTIRSILKQQKISLNKFQQIAGKLQHASFGMTGGKGLFSPLQRALIGNPPFVHLTPALKQTLSYWRNIVRQIAKQPTSVLQLVMELPSFIGYSDACKLGAGGTWVSGMKHINPFLWQVPWPQDIKNDMVSDDNPKGHITINDLELAGLVLNWLALECTNIPLKYEHVGTFCDNTSAVSWAYKMRSSASKAAGQLLRILSLRIHSKAASSITPLSIAGEDNDMADIISRAFKNGKYFEAEHDLFTYFNSHFPLPQNASWQECRIPNKWISRVIACLRGEQLPMAWLQRLPKTGKNTGIIGAPTPPHATSAPSSTTSPPPSNETSSLQLSLQGSGQVCMAEELRSKFKASQMLSRPSPRPSNWLEN
jgi:hypothetical protein